MKRVWLMSDCPGCGQTQYQPGPPEGVHLSPLKKLEWKCFTCGTSWMSAPKGSARDSGGR